MPGLLLQKKKVMPKLLWKLKYTITSIKSSSEQLWDSLQGGDPAA
jgi:hypothetical protein